MDEIAFIDGRRANLGVAARDFKYYIFDWDDNILHMPTRIYMEKLGADGRWTPTTVSTGTFALVRADEAHYRMAADGGREAAFRDFQDEPDAETADSAFIRDTRAALARVAAGEPPGPSFKTLRKTLREGRIFAIVTARGHDPATLRKGVEMFIDRILSDAEKAEMVRNLRGWIVCYEGEDANAAMTDEQVVDNYLSMNRYHAVTNPAFIAAVKAQGTPGAEKSETRKQFAILDFLEWLFRMIERIGARKPISVGFSDDDPGNVAAVADFIRHNLAERFPSVKFVVYDTSDPDVEKGHKLVVSGQLPLF